MHRPHLLSVQNVNVVDEDGWTPLLRAYEEFDSPAVVMALLDRGADVDAEHPYIAIKRDHEAVALALLERGADVNVVDEDGWTPLHLACGAFASPTVAMALLDRGADVDVEHPDSGEPPVDRAALWGQTIVLHAIQQWRAIPRG